MRYKPVVQVSINPPKVVEGQMLSIQAAIYDDITKQPMKFDKFYMQIIDNDGLEVWPLSTMQKNSARMDKLISTSELKPGKYLVRISPSKNLSPMGAAEFVIEAKTNAIVPLIPLALLAIPSSSVADKVENEIAVPFIPPKIAWMIYQTEKDSKVCPICLPHQGKKFHPNDPELIVIGPEELGGQTHYRCRCHYDYVTVEQVQKLQQLNADYQAKIIKVAQIANVYWASQKALNPLVKV